MNNKKQANQSEDLAERVLGQRGVDMLVQIHTPYKIIGKPKNIGGNTYYPIVFSDKAFGDRRGVFKGRSVLAEVKSIKGDRIYYSELKPHQHSLLTYHSEEVGGISLLVWVSDYGVYVMNWDKLKDWFVKGTSLKIEKAASLDVMDMSKEFDR